MNYSGSEENASMPSGNGFLLFEQLDADVLGAARSLDENDNHQFAEGLADEAQVTKRLLRNPADIAAVFRPLYGEEVAARINSLITDHLVLAAELVKAAKAGNNAAAAEIEQRWYANAAEIATFLNCINPYWAKERMLEMWRQHLALVKAQAVARLNKDYALDIAYYDEGEQLLLKMADEFTEGIIRQFPFWGAM